MASTYVTNGREACRGMVAALVNQATKVSTGDDNDVSMSADELEWAYNAAPELVAA